MTNQLATLPWVIDTEAATVIFSKRLKVLHMEFTGYTDASHKIVVTDANGKPVWMADGTTDLDPVRSGPVGWINGLIVPTLDSGYLYVYLV